MARQGVTTSSLLERARREGNPVIDGETVTFVWQGRSAPRLICDLYEWEENPQALKRAGGGVWGLTINLPHDAYLEYAFLDPKTKRHVPDPLNPHSLSNRLGGRNHFFYMPEAAPSPLARRLPDVPGGTLSRHRVEAAGLIVTARRDVTLYRPPVSGPVPLLVVYDGNDYLSSGRLPLIVDNLIARKTIRPIAMAFLQNGGRRGRMVEYACSDSTLAFLMGTVLPLARAHLNLVDLDWTPGAFGVMGASLGGLMALYTCLRLPQVFGRALCQSGAFQLWGLETAAMQLVRTAPRSNIRVWMDVGRFEELLDGNRKMHALLVEKHYDVAYHEYNGAHNFTSWRNDLGGGLEKLFA